MGDRPELQITPETPGRPSIRNPFESPNDYHHLHEALVPSPSVFKSSRATPAGKFNWSIDEMASLLPVHIDPEDIQRQSLYLSQTSMDSDIEEKRQNAIEQFFTKGAIVPSPWAGPTTRKAAQKHLGKISTSPLILEEPQTAKKLNVACQTALTLPTDFDLEKILGEYYRSEEVCEGTQDSLSSSSLRRKLFLDGRGSSSGSDTSSPPSPDRSYPREEASSPGKGADKDRAACVEAVPSAIGSPLSGGMPVPTPSTSQFSSSPIRGGRFHNYSLGSFTSPLLPDGSSPAGLPSPTLSPIGPLTAHTPIGTGERRQLSFETPDDATVPLDMDVNSAGSPYVDGCSPIRSCSPHKLQPHAKPRPRARCWASPPLISPIRNAELQDHQADSLLSPPLPSMELDPSSPSPPCKSLPRGGEALLGLERLGDGEEEEEEGGMSPVRLTSSRMASVSAVENSNMFVSLLAEGSSIRYDCSMQVDSGYNTTSAGTASSLIDGVSSDYHSKEFFSSNLPEDGFPNRPSKTKTTYSHL
ncbi:protein aurora borealis [Aplochiton taeniatus]